jgi:hypothetical protein
MLFVLGASARREPQLTLPDISPGQPTKNAEDGIVEESGLD